MLTFDDIVGQPAAVDLLRGMLMRERVPHAMILHGPDSVGKATVAGVLAAAMLCEADEPHPCGSCHACFLFERGSHPDMLRVGRLSKDEASKDRGRLIAADPETPKADLTSRILIDQIRTLARLVGLTPRRDRRRVFIIDPADRLNRESQNALLKTLEEPPERTVLLLVTSRPHLLLPTVRSRCFSVGFGTMRTSELARVLEQRGMERGEAAARAAIGCGRLGLALELDLDAARKRRDDVLEMLDALAGRPEAADRLPAMAAALAGKDEPTLVDGLELMQGLLRDAARIESGDTAKASLVHADLQTRLEPLGRRLGAARAADLVRSVERLRGDLRFNANRTLLAESLLAAIAGGPLP